MTPVRHSVDDRVVESLSSMLTEVSSYISSWSDNAVLRLFEMVAYKNNDIDHRSASQTEEEFPPAIFYADPKSEEIDVVGTSSQDDSQQEDISNVRSPTVMAPHYSDISNDDLWTERGH